MNIKKVRKLLRDPKGFFSDSVHYNKLLNKKNNPTLGFIILGNESNLTKLTLDSLKKASNFMGKSTLRYKIVPFDDAIEIENKRNIKRLSYYIKELNTDFIKIIAQGDRINSGFIKSFHYEKKLDEHINIVITTKSMESNKVKTDPLFDNLKTKKSYSDINTQNITFLPMISNLIFNRNLFQNDNSEGIINSLQWDTMCCIRAIDAIPNNISHVYIKNAITFPYKDSNLGIIISELTKDEILILPLLISFRMHLLDKNVSIVAKRTIFYFIHCIVLSFLKNKKAEEILSTEAKNNIYKIILNIVTNIGIDVIRNVSYSNYNHIHKAGYYSLLNETLDFNMCYIEDTDISGKKLKIKIATQENLTPLILLDKKSVIPSSLKTRVYSLLGNVFSNEIYLWIPFVNLNQKLFIFGEVKNHFLHSGKKSESITINQAIACIKNKNKVSLPLPLKVKILRKIAKNKFIAQFFSQAWLLIDNEVRADDNAEHFYRYILNNHKNINAFFILNKNSCDWSRLKNQGFKLIKFGGLVHRLALLNAKMLLSSHANPAIINFLPRKHFSDMLSYKFVFLQHGITKDDQSEWLNSRKIDYLVTAAQHEYADIAEDGRYRYTSVETVLTGFPRYDNLVKPKYDHKKILILPTWRKSLAGELLNRTSKRVKNEFFDQSEFCKQWSQFLNSEKLTTLSRKHGYSILFYPHPNLVDYLDDIKIPDHVEIGFFGKESFQEVFKKSSILITDFSSVAFDVAYMSKPIIYFQFDIDTFFSEHSYSKGYYEYDELGFGPVVHDIESLNKELQINLENNCLVQHKYNNRINSFFPYNDHNNSERLFQALTKSKAIEPCLHTLLAYIQHYNNKIELIELNLLIRKHIDIILKSTDFYHDRVKEILNDVLLTSFIYGNNDLYEITNYISDLILSKTPDPQILNGNGLIQYSANDYINLISKAEKGEYILYSFDTYPKKHQTIGMIHNYLLFLVNCQKNNLLEGISIFNQYFDGIINIIPKRILIHYIHALIKTSNIVDACDKLKPLSLNSNEKKEVLVLLYENYKDEHIRALSIPFLKPEVNFPTNTIDTYFHLSSSTPPEDYMMFFSSGIYTEIMVGGYLSIMFEKRKYSDIIRFLCNKIIFDSFITTYSHKRIYLLSLYKTDGVESFISEALWITKAGNFVDAIDRLRFDEFNSIECNVFYDVLEEITKNSSYSLPCIKIYKYAMFFYRKNRAELAKKLITASLLTQHEEYYVNSNNWSGPNDYKTLIDAMKEMEQILA